MLMFIGLGPTTLPIFVNGENKVCQLSEEFSGKLGQHHT